jgi:hypothetical protein
MDTIRAALALGWFHLVVPLALWELLFFVASVMGGVLALRWCRARLRRAGLTVGWPTALFAPAQLVLVPILVGWFAASFSLNRSIAGAIADGGPALVEKIWGKDPLPEKNDEGMLYSASRHAAHFVQHESFERVAARFRSAAQVSLLLLLGSAALVHGLCMGGVWLASRGGRRAPEPERAAA